MNKKSLILAASALAMVLSCNVREESLPLPRRVTFQAVQGDNPSTRTALQSDGSVFWTPGDAINLFYGEAISTKMVFDSTAIGAVAQASFTGMLPEGFYPDGKDEFWAVYPYDKDNVFDGSSVTLTLPDLQPALAGTFADDLFISLARSTGYELSFYNLCGGIKFSVNTPGITRVSFFGHQEEVLAGKVKVGFDENGKPLVQEIVEGSQSIQLDAPSGGFEVGKWYYMVALPNTLAMGYTMSFFQDGDLVSERSVETPVAIKRSIWGRITGADEVEEPEQSSNEIWYTTSDGNTVDYYTHPNYPVDFSLVSNTYENGKGVMVFDSPVTSISYMAFASKSTLTSISLPDTVTSIDESAFSSCSSLAWPEIPESVTSIGNSAFYGCAGFTEVTIPDTVTEFGSSIFQACSNLETIYCQYATDDGKCLIVDGVLDYFACVGVGDIYSFPNTITTIGASALRNSKYSGTLVFGDAVTSIGKEAFAYSYYIKDIQFGVGLVSIGDGAFNGCGADGLDFPATLEEIGSGALAAHCDSIIIRATTPPTAQEHIFDTEYLTSDAFPVYVPAASLNAYKTATNWSNYADWYRTIESALPISASKYLTFTSTGTTAVSLTNTGDNAPVLYYSTDAQTWYEWDYGELSFTEAAPLYICGVNPDGFSHNNDQYSRFTATGDMFIVTGDVMSLVKIDEGLLTIPNEYCFFGLFYDCTLLLSAPELPATTLTKACYDFMFWGCSGLSAAPELPATELAEMCYYGMFWGCNLTIAPELPAPTLVSQCYGAMFFNCYGINYVKCLATDISAEDCTKNWLYNVSSSGTFVKASDSQWSTGASGIPEGWTVVNEGEEQTTTVTVSKYLTFSSQGTTTLSLTSEGGHSPVVYYSTDAQTWTQWDYSELTFTADAPLYICGDNPQGFNISNTYYSRFSATGDVFSVTGDIMSLLDKETDVLTIPNDYCFFQLFYGCTYLVSGPSLPATTLTEACYKGLFSSCYNLESAPALPATTLAPNCYEDLFYACESLTVAPELPATTMVTSCYADMFHGCSHISAAPSLPATTLAEGCYSQMFFGCSSLTEAPALPVTTLAPYCYYGMFNGTGISAAPELPAISLQPHCYEMMFVGCHSLVNAPALPATSLAEACYESMFYSCSALTTAPELPADVLVDYCYNAMFWACGNLSFVKCLATDLSAEACTSGWLSDVSGQGTFIKAANTQWSEGISGIPEGWTVMDDGPVSVAAVYDLPDGLSVSLENVLVYAVGSRSFVVGDDAAENFINVYYGDDMPFGVQVGDRVSVSAEKITFMGMPEMNNIETVEILSSNNSLPYVTYSPEVGQYDRVTPVRASGLVFQRSNSVYTFNYLLAMEEDADNASVDIQYPPMYLYWPDSQYFDYNDQYVDVEGFWLFRNEAESNNNGLHNILIANVYNTNTPYVDASVQEVLEGYDGMYYKVTATVSQIADTDYGNLYLTDNSSDSQLYIYGLFNLNGLYPKDAAGGWDGFSIAENSVITILGKRSTYNNTIELEKATLIRVSN